MKISSFQSNPFELQILQLGLMLEKSENPKLVHYMYSKIHTSHVGCKHWDASGTRRKQSFKIIKSVPSRGNNVVGYCQHVFI